MTHQDVGKIDLSGYESWEGHDPFEDHAGPYFMKRLENGEIRCAFHAKAFHCNGGGFLHGGALLTFADYALFAIGDDYLDGPCVTVSLNGDFIAAGHPDRLIEARGDVVRNTRSLVFIRGEIYCGEETLFTFNGIIKKIKKRPA